MDDDIEYLTQQVAQCLIKQRWKLTSAESCTGGWIAKCCTDLAGSSAWFEYGWVSYSNQAKQTMLAVQAATLDHYGAVSEHTVIEMAQGALSNANADICVAVSGIAGPSGGSIEKPLGTVCFAWITASTTETATYHFSGNREAVRRQAVITALTGILKNARA